MIEGQTVDFIYSVSSERHLLTLVQPGVGAVPVLADRGQLTKEEFYWDNLPIYFEAFEKAMNEGGSLEEIARTIRAEVRAEHVAGLVTSPELVELFDGSAMAALESPENPDR